MKMGELSEKGSLNFKERLVSNTFHSSTDSGRIPRIPAGIQEFRGIPGIPEDSGRNRQESNWNQQRTSLFRLYFAFLFQKYVLEQGN